MPSIITFDKAPPGSAPKAIRQALVGVEFVADYPPTFILMYDFALIGSGLQTGRTDCCVSARNAHDALLAAGKPYAASYFKNLFLFTGTLVMALSPDESRFIRSF
jgi:hypothetical protein